MARVALLPCVGGLAFGVCVFRGFLHLFLLASSFLTIAPLCSTIGQGAIYASNQDTTHDLFQLCLLVSCI